MFKTFSSSLLRSLLLIVAVPHFAKAAINVPFNDFFYYPPVGMYVWSKANPLVAISSVPYAPSFNSKEILINLNSAYNGNTYGLEVLLNSSYDLYIKMGIRSFEDSIVKCRTNRGTSYSYSSTIGTIVNFRIQGHESQNLEKGTLSCYLGRGKKGFISIKSMTLVPNSNATKLIAINSTNSCITAANSSINMDSLSLHEQIPLVGVPFQLNYSSDRYTVSNSFQDSMFGLGGWSVDPVHYYDLENKILHLGDGSIRNIQAIATGDGYYIADQLGNEVYYFDLFGKHLFTKDALTGIQKLSFTYNERGNLLTIKDRFNNTTSFEYLEDESGIKMTSPYGQETTLKLDENGYLASVTNPSGEKYQMSNSSLGRLLIFERPNGLKSTASYDQEGRVSTDIGAGGDFIKVLRSFDESTGTQTVTSLTAMNRATVYKTSSTSSDSSSHLVKSPENSVSFFSNEAHGKNHSTDAYGNVFSSLQEKDPRFGWMASYEKSSSYKVANSPILINKNISKTADLSDENNPFSFTKLSYQTTLQNNSARTYNSTYDALTRELTSITPLSKKITQALNESGLISSTQVGNTLPVNYNYDERGRVVSTIQGKRESNFSYDEHSNLEKIIDPKNQTFSFEYDDSNRMTAKIFPDGRKIKIAYDLNSNVKSITPPGRPAHNFVYNLFESVSSYLPPSLSAISSGATFYSYNLDKQITKINRPDGKEINFNYGETSGLLNSISSSSGNFILSYLPNSKLVSSINSPDNVRTTIEYAGNIPTKLTNSGALSSAITFTYGNDGTLSKTSINGGNDINMTYDLDSYPTKIGAENLSYNSNGELKVLTHGIVTEQMTYNEYGELIRDSFGSKIHKEKKRGKLYSLKLKRDDLGRIIEKEEELNNHKENASFVYNTSGQLIEVRDHDHIIRKYEYDSNGNRVKMIEHGRMIEASYDDQDRLLRYGKNQYKYNANGDLEEKISHEGKNVKYTYDVFGNLKKVQIGKKDVIEYLIDGQNRQVGKKLNGKLIQAFVYQSQTQVAAELDGNGNITKRFVYGSKANVPDYFIANNKEYKIISDQVGTPKLIVDVSSGKIIQNFEFDEFGKLRDNDDYNEHREGKMLLPFGFAGGLYDPDTGLVRFGARDYDSEIGRWTSKDPINFKGGDSNLYGYVLQEPVNKIDPPGTGPISGGLCYIFDIGYNMGQGIANFYNQTQIAGLYDQQIRNIQNQMNSPNTCSTDKTRLQSEISTLEQQRNAALAQASNSLFSGIGTSAGGGLVCAGITKLPGW